MGDTYNVNQAGAVGRNARSDNNNFFQYEPKKQTLAEAADEIQKLLKQLQENNPTATEPEQIARVNEAIKPDLKQRAIAALRDGSETAIDEFVLENKYLKVVKAIVKGWLQGNT
jgi:CHASE3 domain sensor protein